VGIKPIDDVLSQTYHLDPYICKMVEGLAN